MADLNFTVGLDFTQALRDLRNAQAQASQTAGTFQKGTDERKRSEREASILARPAAAASTVLQDPNIPQQEKARRIAQATALQTGTIAAFGGGTGDLQRDLKAAQSGLLKTLTTDPGWRTLSVTAQEQIKAGLAAGFDSVRTKGFSTFVSGTRDGTVSPTQFGSLVTEQSRDFIATSPEAYTKELNNAGRQVRELSTELGFSERKVRENIQTFDQLEPSIVKLVGRLEALGVSTERTRTLLDTRGQAISTVQAGIPADRSIIPPAGGGGGGGDLDLGDGGGFDPAEVLEARRQGLARENQIGDLQLQEIQTGASAVETSRQVEVRRREQSEIIRQLTQLEARGLITSADAQRTLTEYNTLSEQRNYVTALSKNVETIRLSLAQQALAANRQLTQQELENAGLSEAEGIALLERVRLANQSVAARKIAAYYEKQNIQNQLNAQGAGFIGVGGAGGRGGRGGASAAADPNAQSFLGRVNPAGGALSVLRYAIPSAIFFQLARGLREAYEIANQLELEFAIMEDQLAATGATGENAMEGIRQSIFDTATSTGLAVEELSFLSRQLVGAFSSQDIQDTFQGDIDKLGGFDQFINSQVESAGEIAKVAGLPLAEITDGLTAASIAFGESFERIGDVAVALEKSTGVLAKETVGFIGDIAPVAEEAGFSLEQVAAVAALTQQRSGRTGAALAEALGRVIPAVSESTTKLAQLAAANDELRNQEIGLDDGSVISFAEALAQGNIFAQLKGIAGAFADLDKASQNEIVQLLGGRREAQALIPALANIDQLNENIQKAEGSAGSLDDRFAKIQGTVKNTFERVIEQLKQLALTFFEAGIGDALKLIGTGFENLAKLINPVLTLFKDINELLQGMPAQILLVIAAWKGFNALRTSDTLKNQFALFFGGAGATAGAPRRLGLAGRTAAAYRQTAAPIIPNAVPGVFGPATGAGFTQQAATASSRLAGVKAAGSGLLAAAGGLPVLALAGAVSAFTITQKSFERYDEEFENLRQELAESDNSAEDLRKRAEELRAAGSDISLFNSLTGWLRENPIKSEADQLESVALLLDEANASVAERVDLLLSDLSLLGEYEPDFEVRFDRDAITSIFTSGSSEEDIFANFERLVGEAYGLAGQEANDKANEIFEALGGDFSQISVDALEAFFSESPLQNLAEIYNDTAIEDSIRQNALDLAELLLETEGSEETERALDALSQTAAFKAGELNQDRQIIERKYELGLISFQQYIALLRENTENLQVIAEEGGALVDAELEALEGELNELRIISERRTAIVTRPFEVLSGSARAQSTEGAEAAARIAVVTATSAQITSGEDYQALVDQYVEAQQFLRDELVESLGDTAAAKEAAAAPIDIPIALQVASFISVIENDALIKNFKVFSDALEEAFGITGKALFEQLVTAQEVAGATSQQITAFLNTLINTLRSQISFYTAVSFGFLNSPALAKAEELQTLLDDLETIVSVINAYGEVPVFSQAPGDDQQKKEDDALKKAEELENAKFEYFKAVADRNQVGIAQIEVGAAQAAVERANKTLDDDADDWEAAAQLVQAVQGVRDALKDQADAVRDFESALAGATGDSVLEAQIELDQAFADLQYALDSGDQAGADRAKGAVAGALVAIRDAIAARREQFAQVLLLLGGDSDDPIRQAEVEIFLATEQLAEALGIDQQLAAKERLLSAERELAKVTNDIRLSQFELRKAELDFYEEDIASANLAVTIAEQQLADALALNTGEADINNKRAAVIAARKAAADTNFDEQKENFQFLFDMEQITRQEFISYLEGLKSLVGPNTDRYRDLELTIKRLKDDISGDLQTNLPSNLTLPTLYEARRLNQSTGFDNGTGAAIGYQDNRNMNITVVVDGNVPANQLVAALEQATGIGRNGNVPRIY